MNCLSRTARVFVLILLAIVVAAALLSGFILPMAGRRVRPEHIAGPIVFATFIFWQFARRTSPIRIDAFAWLAAAWVAVNALSSWLYAPDASESLVHVIRIGFLAMTFVTVANLPPIEAGAWPGRARLWLVLGFVAVAYGLVTALLARFGGPWLPGVYEEPGLGAAAIKGTLLERNLLGIFAATFLSIAMYWLTAQRGTSHHVAPRGILSALAVVSAVLLVFTLTRSAWLAVIAAGPVVYLLFDRRSLTKADRPLVVTTFATPVVLVLTFLLVGLLTSIQPNQPAGPASQAKSADDVSGRLSTIGQLPSDFTLKTRLQDARWAIDDWRSSPWLGRGTGSFAQIHGIRAGTEAWVSNLVLHTLLDTGVVGLVIQLSLILLVVARAWRVAARAATPDLAIGLRGLVLGFFVMLIAYQATDGSWLALFWIHLGLLVNGIYCATAGER